MLYGTVRGCVDSFGLAACGGCLWMLFQRGGWPLLIPFLVKEER